MLRHDSRLGCLSLCLDSLGISCNFLRVIGFRPVACRMSFDDFARHFTHLDLVHVGPDDWMSEPALHSKQPWRAVLARRRWRAGYNAGGGPAYTETTAMNPQFHIQIPRSASNKCHVVVSVTQYYEPTPQAPDTKKKKRLFAIGFAVYEVPHAMTRLSPQFVMEQVRLLPPTLTLTTLALPSAKRHQNDADSTSMSIICRFTCGYRIESDPEIDMLATSIRRQIGTKTT